MGRTIPSYRIATEFERPKWKPFRQALDKKDRKIFDAIMDAGGAAKIQGVKGKFPYRKYIKEDQMERFNERLLFRIFLLKKQNER